MVIKEISVLAPDNSRLDVNPNQDDILIAQEFDQTTREELLSGLNGEERSYAIYLIDINPISPTTREQEQRLVLKWQNGDQESFDYLVKANLRYVIFIAKRYRYTSSLTFLDLIQEGNIGLMKAVTKFDPSLNNRLTTFATRLIKTEIINAINNMGTNIRVPRNTAMLNNRYRKMVEKYIEVNGTSPKDDEICSELNITPKKLSILKSIPWTISLEQPTSNDSDTEIGDLLSDISSTSIEIEDTLTLKQAVAWLSITSPIIYEMFAYIIGLTDGIGHNFADTGRKFNVTRECARQNNYRAISILKKYLNQ